MQAARLWSPQGRRRLGWAAGRGADRSALSSPALPTPSQAAVENHLEELLYQPQRLLEDLREAGAQQFHTAMRCLWEDKKDHLVRLRAPRAEGKVGATGVCWRTEPDSGSPPPQPPWELWT